MHPTAVRIANFIVRAFDAEIIVYRDDYDPLEERAVRMAILAMPSYGCAHYYERGGCAMCGFNNQIDEYGFRNLHAIALIALVQVWLLHLGDSIRQKEGEIGVLAVFMAGSFLNKKEMPLKAQDLVFEFFAKSRIKKILIESRPEYIVASAERLKRYMAMLEGKQLEVAIGFEAVNDHIRNRLINKAISRPLYRKALKTINASGAYSATYVLVGAPGLSEREIVREAVASAEYAWSEGSDIVNIETYCVQENTAWADLYREGGIRVPSLWCVVEIIKKVGMVSKQWRLGGFSDWPIPIATPHSCDECEDELTRRLNVLRQTHNLKLVTDIELCPCACFNH